MSQLPKRAAAGRRVNTANQREVIGTIGGAPMTKLRQHAAVPDDEDAGQLAHHRRGLRAEAVRQRADRAALDTELADAVQRYRALKHADAATMPEASPPAETP